MFGKTINQKQRFRCLQCGRTFIWKLSQNKARKEQHWFKLWVTEGYSIRQLSHLSGHSPFKLKQIKNYWLSKEPPALSQRTYKSIDYLAFDGTYFHKDGCLALFMNVVSRKPLQIAYIERENYENVFPIITKLRDKGISSIAITTDGHPGVLRALKEIWPGTILQRCLFHIQNQGLMWLRTFPKTESGKELRSLYGTIARIRSAEEMIVFKIRYDKWRLKHKNYISSLPSSLVAFKDLRRAMSLINNALPNMFHFIKDKNIASTTNILEGFFSQLKHQYRNHRGLSERHKISYLKWFCYFKTIKNSNTF